MRFSDQFRFVRQNIKKNKMRIFMTVLASAMGTTFLIVLASVGFGLHDTLLKDVMEQDMINEISIYGYDDGEYRSINDQDVAYFKSLENVRAVRHLNYLSQSPTYRVDDFELMSNTQSVDFASEQAAGMNLSEGRYPETDQEIIVGYHFVEELYPIDVDPENIYDEEGNQLDEYTYQDELLGKTIAFEIEKIDSENNSETRSVEVTIVGVVEKPSREWQISSNVYISEGLLTELESFTGTRNANPFTDDEYAKLTGEKMYDEVFIHSDSIQHIQNLTTKLSDEHYYAYSVANEIRQINMLFNVAKAGLIFIGTIAVLIASIGIYNTMTMAVTERAPDIGIMKAIGANPKTIKQIFVLESSYIGLMGAAIGTAVAYVISLAVNLGIPLILEAVFEEQLPEGLKFSVIPWSLIAIAISICLVVTIISGARPAKRATQIDVLKAMRRDL
ncbi:ABC transporter permease [Amphibacillus indicireducens]|uniref:ABC transporter permease YtrF n=1 Tax=Amphibacillus indicireducens TaxID=1076330 RepID=A0ABP7VUS2_9BACI